MLDKYLDQITVSAQAIGGLEFPAPKIFTTALLGQHEITTLIRDTEPHERSLYSLDPAVKNSKPTASSRRATTFNTDGAERRRTVVQVQQRQGSAVARVLGNDMLRQIQQSSRGHGRSRGVDVEVLLRGAEKLCSVYPVDGAKERISTLRSRHAKIAESVSHYEKLVIKQQAQLNKLNNSGQYNQSPDEDEETAAGEPLQVLTEDDIRAEEEDIRALEARKKALEDRISGIERDLGGLMH